MKKGDAAQQLELSFNQLLRAVKRYNPHCNENRLKKAFNLGKEAHKTHFRDSGEPYFMHPLAVSMILTDYFADDNTIIAGLLHDAVEDSPELTIEMLEKEFGKTVACLVEGVTEIGKVIPSTQDRNKAETDEMHAQRDIETIRKIFEYTKKDVRVILIKLADRLHNMSTLGAKKGVEKRVRKAQETAMVFVPVAVRLGLWKMKQELESLCTQYISPEIFRTVGDFWDRVKTQRKHILDDFMKALESKDKNGLIQSMDPYERGYFSLQHTLKRKGTLSLNNNLILEICVKEVDDCYLLLSLLRKHWKTRAAQEHDFVNNPRDNGYQAYHTQIITQDGKTIRCRLMTQEMRDRNWYGVAYDLFNKKGAVDLSFLSSFDEISEGTEGRPEEFLEAAKIDLLQRKIEVHCEGKSFHVPVSSTALDFAFYAFPDQATCVRQITINDALVNRGVKLRAGDLVDVKFAPQPTVSFEWFNLVNTTVARIAIQKALKKWDSEKKIMSGKNIIQREFDFYHKGRVETIIERHKKHLLERFSVRSVNDLYVLVAEGGIQSYEVFSECFPKTKKGWWRGFSEGKNWFFKSFFSNTYESLHVKLEGLLDQQAAIMKAVYKLRDEHGLKLNFVKTKENHRLNIFQAKISCATPDRKSFHNFWAGLESQDGIIRIVPMLPLNLLQFFVVSMVVTLGMWGTMPFLLNWATKVESFRYLKEVLVYLNVIPLIVVNYILYSFIRNYFSQLRSSVWLMFSGAILNLLAIAFFLWQLLVHDMYVNVYLICGLLVCINFIYLYQYLVRRVLFHQEDAYLARDLGLRKDLRQRIVGYFSAAVVIMIWGVDPLFIKELVADIDVTFTVWMRFLMGSAFLSCFLAARRFFHGKRPKVHKVKYDKFFLLMVICLSANFLLFHGGLIYTIGSDANLIENFSPVVILFLMGVLVPGLFQQIGGSKKDIGKTLGLVVIGSVGAGLVLGNYPESLVKDYESKLFGDLLEFIGMLFFAVFLIANNAYAKKHPHVSSLRLTTSLLFYAALIFTPVVLGQGLPVLTEMQWGLMAFIGFASAGVAYTLLNIAAKSIDVIPVALLLNVTVIITLVLEHYVYGLELGPMIVVGGLLMITAAVGAELMNIKREKGLAEGRAH